MSGKAKKALRIAARKKWSSMSYEEQHPYYLPVSNEAVNGYKRFFKEFANTYIKGANS